MNTDEIKMTVHELDELCRLYMDGRLSVLEEKELEYILTRTEETSPYIDDVRSLINISVGATESRAKRASKVSKWLWISGIAASIAAMVCTVNIYSHSFESGSQDESQFYAAAYIDGHRLDDSEAIVYNDIAMARADSLMNYADATEQKYMVQAENIISHIPYN